MSKFKHLLFLFASNSLYALTTLHVTLPSDNNPGGEGEPGDLRYALNSMNNDLNTIQDDYAIVFDMPMTIQLNGILPIINNSPNSVNITIGNPGSIPTVTIDGNNGEYSGFFIPMGNVTIQNMIFQNLTAKGGDGGDGISGGGGGMGAGGAIYAPTTFLYGSYPSITLKNVLINNTSAIGGNGGSYLDISSLTGNEGGGGGGGFSGNGGSVTVAGITGGGGGGGFGGDGGNVTRSFDDFGGGGGGGGGLGSRATLGMLSNLGTGGSDQSNGLDGNGYGLTITAGFGAGGWSGGNNAGGGGGGSNGSNGAQPGGNIPPKEKLVSVKSNVKVEDVVPSGGNGGDGAGGGGGAVVMVASTNDVDGEAGRGGYGGGGGGGSGTGAYGIDYTVEGGLGGLGGGGAGGAGAKSYCLRHRSKC